MSEPKSTPFYDNHLESKAKLVDFAGWSLPIHYGSLVEEHHTVRSDAGMFDVSHMTLSDIQGTEAIAKLRTALTNDIASLSDNTALYSCICREDGGVVDDVIAYRINDAHYRLISNAGTRAKVLDWLGSTIGINNMVTVAEGELAMIAIQGPNAIEKLKPIASDLLGAQLDIGKLDTFACALFKDVFIARTGYTGEDGVELVVAKSAAKAIWSKLIDAGIRPCGLGARDTLRLEAAMSLYGNDLDEQHSPFESGIGWTVDFSDSTRQFVGRDTLQQQKQDGSKNIRIGLQLSDRGVLRAGQTVCLGDQPIGVVTSGTYSPTLEKTIAIARVERANAPAVSETGSAENDIANTDSANNDPALSVIIRDKPVFAFRVKLPFLSKA